MHCIVFHLNHAITFKVPGSLSDIFLNLNESFTLCLLSFLSTTLLNVHIQLFFWYVTYHSNGTDCLFLGVSRKRSHPNNQRGFMQTKERPCLIEVNGRLVGFPQNIAHYFALEWLSRVTILWYSKQKTPGAGWRLNS